jgi:hypothetical protein
MLKKNLILLAAVIIFAAIITSGIQSAEQYHWRLESIKNACRTYTSPSPGKKYIAAKCECVFPVKMEVIGVVLRDIASYPEWMADCSNTKVLKTVSDIDDIFILWYQQHIPVFTDRDAVLKSGIIFSNHRAVAPGAVIYVKDTKEMEYDAGKGFVRMPSLDIVFTIDWVSRDFTRVSFMVDPDVGPGLPKDIANSTIKNTAYKTMMGMFKQVRKSKYTEIAKTITLHRMVEEAVKLGTAK